MRYLLLFISLLCVLGAQDAELTNYKGGISVVWGVGDGSDKGSAYMEEYWFHDKLLFDTKTVYLKSDTLITMSHNAYNIGSVSGRTKTAIGANGLDGVPDSGDEGQIRYRIDRMWNLQQHWATNTPRYPAYTAPFTLASQEYETGVSVVGTTGGNGVAQTSASFYWRGIVDSVGDEWHVLSVGDDDSALGGNGDSAASDGKWVVLCVNPTTPAMTVRSTGDGQFYTTPAWTYWTHKIHDQTTYFNAGTGTVTFELRNIYGANISYRINGGSVVNVGASSVTLDHDDFSAGSNTLEYWYTSTPSTIRMRVVVKNPSFPSAGETHGDRVWGSSNWTAFNSRAERVPYSGRITAAQNRGSSFGNNNQAGWENARRQGYRFGGSNMTGIGAAPRTFPAITNAIMARYLGVSAYASGSPANKTYAAYAKEMMMESPLNQSPVGIERPYWSSEAMPAADIVYRGYWDVDWLYSALIAYDQLISIYRSDQVSGGITPVEDYFIRDRFAEWCHLSAIWIQPGMWWTMRQIGATMVTCVLPNYSTPYFGTSGMDGSTTVYAWAPFQTYNHTWKDLFVDHDYPIQTTVYGNGPTKIFGLEGSVGSDAMLRPPVEEAQFTGTNGEWVDKVDYFSYSQCANDVYLYANLWKLYFSAQDRPYLDNALIEVTAGTLRGSKVPTGPMRQHAILVLNANFPVAAGNAISWIQGLPSNDPNSDDTAVEGAGLLGLFFYDDAFNGGSLPTAPSGLSFQSSSFSSVTLTFTDNSTDETYFDIQMSETSGSGFVSLPVSAPAETGTGSRTYVATGLPANAVRYFRIRAANAVGNSSYSNEVSGSTLQYGHTPPNRSPASTVPSFGF